MRASVGLVGRARIVFAILAAALVCAGSASAAPAGPRSRSTLPTRRRSRARYILPSGTAAGRRLARRHPLPRARAVARATWSRSATRSRSSASPRSPATPAAPAPPAASSGSTGRPRCRTRRTSSTGSPRAATSRTRRSAPSASRSAAARSGTRRSPASRSRRSCPAITWTNLGQALNPNGVPKTGPGRDPLPGRADLALGSVARADASRTCSQGDVTPAVTSVEAARSSRSQLHSLDGADAPAAGTARLPLRHGPGDRRVEAARRAEAPLPRRPRPPPGQEPAGRADRLRRRGRRLVQPVPRRRDRRSAAASSSRTIPGTGRRPLYKKLPRHAAASVNLPGTTKLTSGRRFATRSVRLTGGPLETFGDGFVTVHYSGAQELDAPRGHGLGAGTTRRP